MELRRRTFLLGAAVGAIALSTPAIHLRAQERRKATFAFGSPVDLSALTVVLGNGLGYYDAEGIDAEITTMGTTPLATVALDRGDVDFAVGTTTFQFPLLEKGQLPDIVNFFEYIYPYRWDVITLSGSEIQSYQDLKGKKIGVGSLGTTDYPVTRAVLTGIGIDPDREVEWVVVGPGVVGGTALQQGVVDAVASYDVVLGMIEGSGVDVRTLPLPPSVPMMGGVYFTAKRDFLAQNRDLAVGMARVARKSSEFLIANPSAAADVFLQLYPEFAARGVSRKDAVARILPAVERRAKLLHPPFPDTPVGAFSQVEIDNAKAFQGTTADVSKLFTNDLIAEANDFDPAPIIEAARGYTPS